MQTVTNSKYSLMTGGTRRRYKKGGNPDWVWGCYSGGQRHTKRRHNMRRTRRSRTYRRY
jgi:hypothetical protein